jgi:hypothetical protein
MNKKDKIEARKALFVKKNLKKGPKIGKISNAKRKFNKQFCLFALISVN